MSEQPMTPDEAYRKGLTVGRQGAEARAAPRASGGLPRPSLPSGATDQASKVVIMVEMLALLGVGWLMSKPADQEWLAYTLGKGGLGRLVAVLVLWVILALLADLGLGFPAALFGGIVLISYLTAHGAAGGQVLDLERKVFER